MVFRCDSVHDWSAIDKVRLALCVIGLLLPTVKPAPGSLALVQRRRGRTSFAVCDYDIQNLRRLDPQQLQSALATGVVFTCLGSWPGAMLLQFFNIAILNAFWPFFTGIACTC